MVLSVHKKYGWDRWGGEDIYVSIPSGRIHKKSQTVVVRSEAGDFTACSFVPLEF